MRHKAGKATTLLFPKAKNVTGMSIWKKNCFRQILRQWRVSDKILIKSRVDI